MTAPALLIRWFFVVVLVLLSAMWRKQTLEAKLLARAFLVATVITATAAAFPFTEQPGLLGASASWLRQVMVFAMLTNTVAGYSTRICILVGLGYATSLAILGLL
jgi:MFS superfamily sulfate permease-like transporter